MLYEAIQYSAGERVKINAYDCTRGRQVMRIYGSYKVNLCCLPVSAPIRQVKCKQLYITRERDTYGRWKQL